MWLIYTHAARRCRVAVARRPGGLHVSYPGGAAVVVDAAARSRLDAARRGQLGGKAGIETGSEVRAPMTGRVIEVSVAVGDKVAAQDPLVVLEAMKMEYRLVAPQAGTVATVACKTGTLVDLGALLVTLS
jgi:biotin carboxyl carrier protein